MIRSFGGKSPRIADSAFISEAAYVVGDVEIGDNVLLGMNSTILHDVEIGDYCIIAAGCIIKEKMKIPERSFVVGVPGEIRGEISSKQQLWLKESPTFYHQLARQYKLEEL